MNFWQEFQGPNAGYVLELYERFLQDPNSVDTATRAFFEHWQPPAPSIAGGIVAPAAASEVGQAFESELLEKIVALVNLARSIRHYGHLAVQLDPLGGPPPGDPTLDPSYYGLTVDDLNRLPAWPVGGPVAEGAQNAAEAVHRLRQVYCTNTGYDYGQIQDEEERVWLRDAAERGTFRHPLDAEAARKLLGRLTQVDAFERFLQRTFPGKTRFSIEGVDILIPVLDDIVHDAANDGVCMAFLGMAHRGRLNVLAHILDKPYEAILAEFRDPGGNQTAWHEMGWTGDVKYHAGAQHALSEDHVVALVIAMPPNPSHLEFVDPVVEGMARAADTVLDQPGKGRFFPKASLPILIHGDAAFPGQGVVAETLNLSQLDGYTTAGTIHIITNNQLGYTVPPSEGRSTLYASDLAKGLKIPIIHVNADVPEACLEAARTAYAYRTRYHKDFLIDIVGYRRYGHNEGDEPGFTQPLMYQKIEQHPSVRALWAQELIQRGLVQSGEPEAMLEADMAKLQGILDSLKPEEALIEAIPKPPPPGAARRVHTAVPLERLRALNEALLGIPEGFHLNRKLERPRRRMRQAFEPGNENEPVIDWSIAEQLAFATILQDSTPIRLTGQDVERGTFSQRHAVLHDVENGKTYTPLQTIPQAKAAFEIYNSPLSESSAVGFEFGYSSMWADRLVLWEAQYGDFINAAQAMVDEFVISARAKWGQTPSLVLLLPHGNEGAGPDHSSARSERFLSLAAEFNLRLDYPTTAAQYFHLLRRQAALLKTDPLPMIVLTPKGLLRNPLAASRPIDLAEGGWQAVIDDPQAEKERVVNLALCSGKLYVDLISSDLRSQTPDLAIARVEQLYPFPIDEVRELIESYPHLEHVCWIQEEPQNMGGWNFVRPYLEELIIGRWPLVYIGRLPSSSPAEGSATWYNANQQALIERVYHLPHDIPERGVFIERV